jgi:hypothetical protein
LETCISRFNFGAYIKYLVTAPPGGLGHFLSRVLGNDYDFTVGHVGQYHDLEKTYSSQTTNIKEYTGLTQVDQRVVCLHNFDNRDFRKIVPDRVVINVVVNDCWEIYLNNYFRKAIQSNRSIEQKFIEEVNNKFTHGNNSLREEFYWLYLHAIKGNIEWLPTQMQGININFSDFYKLDSFKSVLSKIPEVTVTNLDKIWNHFAQSQTTIISRANQYKTICSAVKQGKEVQIPKYFDNVDFGIMCGIIQYQQGIDMLNLDKDSWL